MGGEDIAHNQVCQPFSSQALLPCQGLKFYIGEADRSQDACRSELESDISKGWPTGDTKLKGLWPAIISALYASHIFIQLAHKNFEIEFETVRL